MKDPIGNLLTVTAFFTRLPVSQRYPDHSGSERSLVECVHFFPIIGLLIGLITGAVWLIAGFLFPPAVSAGLTVMSGLLLTGALHEDGLADCADGLGGTSDRTRALEIMRDSRIGAYGTIALIISVGLRWAALASFSVYGGLAALVIAHTVSRTSIIIAMYTSQYARSQGLGTMAQGEVSTTDVGVTFGIATVLSIAFGGLTAVPAILLGVFTGWTFLQYLKYRLGGYTGDGLGAIQQLTEITILIVLAGFWA